jgi:hypothetical protein
LSYQATKLAGTSNQLNNQTTRSNITVTPTSSYSHQNMLSDNEASKDMHSSMKPSRGTLAAMQKRNINLQI